MAETNKNLTSDTDIKAQAPTISQNLHQASTDSNNLILGTYYPAWAASNCPVDKLDFQKFDVIFFAFVTPTADCGIQWEDGSQATLNQLIACARSSGAKTKIVLSIGGWGGCYWFSQAMSNSVNRTKLLNTLVGVVNACGLDGIDIDWEYPNSPGAGQPYSPADAANLLYFLQLLRSALGPARIISVAVGQLPWLGPDGTHLKDVSEYAAQISFVNIMNYDVFGASSTPGPNAPLGNLCGTSVQPQATAQASLVQWTSAGMPASKLLLGLPLYGYVSKSSAVKLSRSFKVSAKVADNCVSRSEAHCYREVKGKAPNEELMQGDLSSFWGQQIPFNEIVRLGALMKNPAGTYGGSNGFTMGWDNCSDTPYLFSVAKSTVITYDDTWSLSSKALFAKQSRMAGCYTWSVDQDDGTCLNDVIFSQLKA